MHHVSEGVDDGVTLDANGFVVFHGMAPRRVVAQTVSASRSGAVSGVTGPFGRERPVPRSRPGAADQAEDEQEEADEGHRARHHHVTTVSGPCERHWRRPAMTTEPSPVAELLGDLRRRAAKAARPSDNRL